MSSSDTAVPQRADTTADTEAIDAAVSAAAAAARDLTDDAAVWGVLYDHGLAWVDFPRGSGGPGASREACAVCLVVIEGAGLSQPDPGRNTIGFGMAAPTIVVHGTDDQRKLLRADLYADLDLLPAVPSPARLTSPRSRREPCGTGTTGA